MISHFRWFHVLSINYIDTSRAMPVTSNWTIRRCHHQRITFRWVRVHSYRLSRPSKHTQRWQSGCSSPSPSEWDWIHGSSHPAYPFKAGRTTRISFALPEVVFHAMRGMRCHKDMFGTISTNWHHLPRKLSTPGPALLSRNSWMDRSIKRCS